MDGQRESVLQRELVSRGMYSINFKVRGGFLNIDLNNIFVCWEGDLDVIVVYTLGNDPYCPIANVVLEQLVVQEHDPCPFLDHDQLW